MSYSYNVIGKNKQEALELVKAKLDELEKQQPVHANDRAIIEANTGSVINLLADNEALDVSVSFHGYLSWSQENVFNTVSVNCCATSISRKAPE